MLRQLQSRQQIFRLLSVGYKQMVTSYLLLFKNTTPLNRYCSISHEYQKFMWQKCDKYYEFHELQNKIKKKSDLQKFHISSH